MASGACVVGLIGFFGRQVSIGRCKSARVLQRLRMHWSATAPCMHCDGSEAGINSSGSEEGPPGFESAQVPRSKGGTLPVQAVRACRSALGVRLASLIGFIAALGAGCSATARPASVGVLAALDRDGLLYGARIDRALGGVRASGAQEQRQLAGRLARDSELVTLCEAPVL